MNRFVGYLTLFVFSILAYFGSYWLLSRKGGFVLIREMTQGSRTYDVIWKPFTPIVDLEEFVRIEIPTRKALLGDWEGPGGATLSLKPDQRLSFSLGLFSHTGIARYNREYDWIECEFDHLGRKLTFIMTDQPNVPSVPPASSDRDPFDSVKIPSHAVQGWIIQDPEFFVLEASAIFLPISASTVDGD